MPKVKFTILSHGIIEGDLAQNVALPRAGTRSDKHPKAIWGQFPCYSVLVHHEDIGWLLYDTGICPADNEGRVPDSFFEIFPLVATKDDYLENRIKSVGLTKDDIKTVVVSHTHWDHIGGVGLFSNTTAGENIIAPGADYSIGVTKTHCTKESIVSGYFKWNYEFGGLNYRFIDTDYKINNEIELISLEGHTPRVLGLMLHLESGTYIFPSDACGLRMNYGPPSRPPGILYDSLGFERTVDKLRELQRKYDAKIFFSHDMEQFKTFKLAPDFYE